MTAKEMLGALQSLPDNFSNMPIKYRHTSCDGAVTSTYEITTLLIDSSGIFFTSAAPTIIKEG